MNRRTALVRIVAVAVPLAGCAGNGDGGGGGDGGGNDGGGGDASPAETPTRSPTGTTSAADATTRSSPEPESTPSPRQGGDSTGTNTPTPTATPAPTTTRASARERYPDYSWGQLEGVEPVADDTIEMRGFAFHPLVAAVEPGTEVTVTNEDSAGHAITVPRLGVDTTVGSGERVSFTPERTGTYEYVCSFHPPDMLGRLVVTGDAGGATTTPTESPETADDGDGRYD